MITSSCGLPDPLNHPARLAALVDANDHAALRLRLAADAHALLTLYRYGRLHGLLRLRHGGVDEMLPAPWAHGDEEKLAHLMQTAVEMKVQRAVSALPFGQRPRRRRRRRHGPRSGLGRPVGQGAARPRRPP